MKKLNAVLSATAVVAMLSQSATHAAFAAPVLEPATQHFIDALAAKNAPPIYTLSPPTRAMCLPAHRPSR